MAATPPDDGRPTLAGRYALGRALGAGGMGEVLDGWDTRLGRPVAVKLLRPELAARPEIRARFAQEARMAARLSNPHVVAVYDTGEDGGRPFLIMERLSGRTLADDIDAGPMEPALVRSIGLEVLDALGAAHAVGMVHRDVKPSNVLDAGGGRWKVGDFGIAKGLEGDDPALTSTGLVVGTAAYLTPERLAGAPADASSDCYALGVVLYEALIGSRWRSGSALVPQRPPLATLRPGLPADLVAAVERAMSLDPARRYPSASAMTAALSGAAPESTVAMRPPVAATEVLSPGTEVLPRVPPPPPPPPADPVRPPTGDSPAAGVRRAGYALLGFVAVAAVVALVVLLADHHGSGTATTTTSTPASTAAPTTLGGGVATSPATTSAPTTTSPASTTTSSTSTTSTSSTTTTSSTTSTTSTTTSTTVAGPTPPTPPGAIGPPGRHRHGV